MTNTQLLEKKIKQSGLKPGFIYEKLGLSRQGFYNKKNNVTKFRLTEVYVLCDLLDIKDEEEKLAIFYA